MWFSQPPDVITPGNKPCCWDSCYWLSKRESLNSQIGSQILNQLKRTKHSPNGIAGCRLRLGSATSSPWEQGSSTSSASAVANWGSGPVEKVRVIPEAREPGLWQSALGWELGVTTPAPTSPGRRTAPQQVQLLLLSSLPRTRNLPQEKLTGKVMQVLAPGGWTHVPCADKVKGTVGMAPTGSDPNTNFLKTFFFRPLWHVTFFVLA